MPLRSRDKSEARYDDGVVDIRANAITLKKEVPFYTDPVTSQRAKLYTLELDRGLEWPKVRVRVRVRATVTVTVTVKVTVRVRARVRVRVPSQCCEHGAARGARPRKRARLARYTRVRARRSGRQARASARRASLSQALAELQAANAREAAAGNSDTINGFYQSRSENGMGRLHQHLIIRKQYQTGAALANRFYEMYYPNPNPNPNPEPPNPNPNPEPRTA